ncbi:MAG: hypothetical protein NVSMB7_00840 [Chitinophagaceae bacterium]
MKKIAAILLLGVLLFNWCGYRWVINLVQQDADTKLEARLDRNEYDESQLIEIKVPVNMPYQTDWAGFERYDGEIEVNGIHYKYVKRKVQDGQLVLKCIPNQVKQRLESAKDDLFKISNDLQQGNSPKKSGTPASTLVKNVPGDYDNLQQLSISALYATASEQSYNVYQSHLVTDLLHPTAKQPPEA